MNTHHAPLPRSPKPHRSRLFAALSGLALCAGAPAVACSSNTLPVDTGGDVDGSSPSPDTGTPPPAIDSGREASTTDTGATDSAPPSVDGTTSDAPIDTSPGPEDTGPPLVDVNSLPDANGLDSSNPPCGAGNCSPGCCAGPSGPCISNPDDNNCGWNGNACVDCATNHQTCDTTSYTCH
jgi:hypothetical protein